ncbi:MAG: hypothetical protein AAFX44_03060 [Pseudomonadota bacterium]
MDIAATIETALEIGNRIDAQWGLFITVHLAILGAMVYIDEPLHRFEKIIGIAVYLGFAFINLAMMQSQILLLDATYTDIVRFADEGADSELVQRMADLQRNGRGRVSRLVMNISHLVMAVLVILSFATHPLMTRESAERAKSASDGDDVA